MTDSVDNNRESGRSIGTFTQWRLPLILAAICALFAWVYVISVDQAKEQKARELSLELIPSTEARAVDLELTTRLGSLSEQGSVRHRLPKPAPWWPVLLFALAFCGGWSYRHLQRATSTNREGAMHPPKPHANEAMTATSSTTGDQTTSSTVRTLSAIPSAVTDAAPDLAKDFPWDESALDDSQHLSSEERIARLETQNASKAEIIKALEKLVTENREKWLHQDETEARLNAHISDLSADLKVAIRQLQRLQDDSLSHASRKDAI